MTLAGTAALLTALAAADRIDDAAGFFGAGSLLLGAALCPFAYRLAAPPRRDLDGTSAMPVVWLGLRYASFRRGRSVLSAALIAGAVFLVVSVEAFRRDVPATRPIVAPAPAVRHWLRSRCCRSSTTPRVPRDVRR